MTVVWQHGLHTTLHTWHQQEPMRLAKPYSESETSVFYCRHDDSKGFWWCCITLGLIFYLLFLVGWDWVHVTLRSLLAYCTIGDCGAIGRMRIGRGNWSTWRKPAPAPLCPPQIHHDHTRARTRGLTVWTMVPALTLGVTEFRNLSSNQYSKEQNCLKLGLYPTSGERVRSIYSVRSVRKRSTEPVRLAFPNESNQVCATHAFTWGQQYPIYILYFITHTRIFHCKNLST
jgi:hypothetical protein